MASSFLLSVLLIVVEDVDGARCVALDVVYTPVRALRRLHTVNERPHLGRSDKRSEGTHHVPRHGAGCGSAKFCEYAKSVALADVAVGVDVVWRSQLCVASRKILLSRPESIFVVAAFEAVRPSCSACAKVK